LNGRYDECERRVYRGRAGGEQDDEDDSASVGSGEQVVMQKGSYKEGIPQSELTNVGPGQ
jgi:hypothetical protein